MKEHQKDTTLYLSVFNWPTDGKLKVPCMKNKANSAKLLANGESLTISSTDEGMIIQLPATPPDPIASVIKVE
jgi:alpha-L-fucosidase